MQIVDIIKHKQPKIYQQLITSNYRTRKKNKVNLDTWEQDARTLHSKYRGIMEQGKGVDM